MSIVLTNITRYKKKFEPSGRIRILINEKKDKIIRLEMKTHSQLMQVLKNNKLINIETVIRTKKLETVSVISNRYSSLIRNANNRN